MKESNTTKVSVESPPAEPELEHEDLKRKLKPRHMQMIAIGGAIGVGLFYGSAGAIQQAGPAVLLVYAFCGIALFFICRAIGELSVAEPVAGAAVSYSTRYLHPFVGFFLGWNGLLLMAAGSGAEFNALGQYVQYWFPNVPIWVSALVVLIFITIVNLVSVGIYGEVEFWLSTVKVVTIILMIVTGFVIILTGFGNGGKAVGFGNLVNNGGFFPNGIKGILYSVVRVAFSFGGTDFVAVTAGEAENVEKTMPKAINGVFWRILIFYVGATLVMLCLWPWNKIGTTGSPFVAVFSKIGIPAAASIINFVVITAAISSQNGGIYSTSRMVYNLALQGKTPKAMAKVNKQKSPYVTILVIVAVQLIGVVANAIVPAKAFSYFSSLVVFSLVSGWVCELLCQYRFRKIKIKNHEEDQIKFKMPWWPFSSYFALGFMALVMVMIAIIPDFRITYYVAPVWVLILLIAYRVSVKKQAAQGKKPEAPSGSAD